MEREDILARRRELKKEMEAIAAHKGEWSHERSRKFNELEREDICLVDALDRQDRLLASVAKELSSGGGLVAVKEAEASNAFGSFARRGDTSAFGVQGSMTEDPNSAGVLVPYELDSIIQRQALKFSPLRGICRTVNIGTTASKFTTPLLLDGAATAWVNETEARLETTAPRIIGVEYPDGECQALVPVSQWGDEDAALGSLIVGELARGFGRAEGAAFVRGTGVKMPFGVLAAPTATTSDATRPHGTLKYLACNGGAITSNDLVAMVYDLLPEYRSAGTWVMTSTTLGVIRGLKDSTGRFLWEPNLTPGQPSTLLGFPVCEANDWDEIATGKYPIAFGDFQRGYTIVDRATSIIRDPYSQKPFVQIYGRKRVSGNLVDTCAIRLLKMAAS